MSERYEAMILERAGEALRAACLPARPPGPGNVALRVRACGLCRTDLHVVDGELPRPKLPLVLGHQVVGVVTEVGDGVETFEPGQRVGVPWLGSTCGTCGYCLSGRENLCASARFTGYDIDGGYARRCEASAQFCLPIPERYPDHQAAPLLCAGLIGYRALRMAGDAGTLALYGFGQAAHIIIQVARHEGRRVMAMTRVNDVDGQAFARELGADWAGSSVDEPPFEPEAAVIFAPAGELVPIALRRVARGGTVVCAGIHMSDIPSFPYELLWGERSLRSVANLTRHDGEAFMEVAASVPVRTEVEIFELSQANEALQALRAGTVRGAAVLHVSAPEHAPRSLPAQAECES